MQRSLSIFFPCYNDRQSIVTLIKSSLKIAKSLTKEYEVLVVDDGSTDGSREILKNLSKKIKELKFFYHKKNLGYGGTLRTGFQKASKDFIFYTDGDGQYNVYELPLLYNLMTDDVNFVNGIKMSRHDPTYRIVLGNVYNFFARWLFWLPIYDIDCDFRLIRNSLLKKLNLKSNSGAICVELVKKAQRKGAIFRQVSIHHRERSFGESQFFKPERLFSTFFELLSLWVELMIFQRAKRH